MPQLKDSIRLLGGSKGLTNSIRWTHVLESYDAIQFLLGNELAFLTGVLFGKKAEQLTPVLEQLAAHHVAGLVVNTGRYITKVPESTIQKADELGLPLFEIPWEVRLVDVTKVIGTAIVENSMEEASMSYLLEKILLSDSSNSADYLHTAEFYGYNLNGPLRIVNMEFINLQQYAEQSGSPADLFNCQHKIRYLIGRILEAHAKKCLFAWKGSNLVMVVPVDPAHELTNVDEIARAIREELGEKMSGLAFCMGLGGYYTGIEQIKKSYAEAQLAIRLAKDSRDKPYMLYRDAGIFKFLNKVADQSVMVDFYEETVGPLLRYDAENNTEFTETLRVFLEENENTTNTIQRLFIHRNTLQYRLHRIEEILQQSLKSAEEKINLQIAFKIQKFLSYRTQSGF